MSAADMLSTWVFGGVFMSTLDRSVAVTGSGVLPHCDSGVIL